MLHEQETEEPQGWIHDMEGFRARANSVCYKESDRLHLRYLTSEFHFFYMQLVM